MIKTPFTIYYDIETCNPYLKKTKQHKLIKNTSHEKLLKPYLCVAKYWVFIYEPHYDHNDLFFWISSLRTQSKNYINIWN